MNDGGPAFPIIKPHDRDIQWANGMTLRDYFAAAALTGLLPSELPELGAKPADIVKRAYELSDLMLIESKKQTALNITVPK